MQSSRRGKAAGAADDCVDGVEKSSVYRLIVDAYYRRVRVYG